MLKQFRAALSALMLFPILMGGPARAELGEAQSTAHGDAGTLRFGPDGTFTVMIIADIQDTQLISPYLLRSLNSALNDYPPDLVVLLGDQFAGYEPVMRLGNPEQNVISAMDQFLAPIVSRGIPFAVVFGNHDFQTTVPTARQMELYQRYPLCLAQAGSQGVTGCGNYVLPVLSGDGAKALLNLFFFDSGDFLEDGSYSLVREDQIQWYKEASDAAKEANGGVSVPAAAFQHIIVPEIYDALDQAVKGQQGAFEGHGYGQGKYYLEDSGAIVMGEINEAPCPSTINEGQFDAFLEQGDVFAAFFGHDHINDFLASYRGIDLVAVPGATYAAYNSRDMRGVKLIRFNDIDVENYEIISVPFSRYENLSALELIPYYLLTTTKLPSAAKIGLLVVIVIVAFALILIRNKKLGLLRAQAEAASEQADAGDAKDGKEPQQTEDTCQQSGASAKKTS